MVDLALRVALSKFLAHRAGAEIKLFVLDEGLGACDGAPAAARTLVPDKLPPLKIGDKVWGEHEPRITITPRSE